MSKIEWTDQTWNPVTGCTPAGTGCKYCYAKEMHRRLRAMGQPKYQHDFDVARLHPEELEKPLRWRKPRRVFVCSMSDLFHEAVPPTFIARVFATMANTFCEKHTFQILTKRPDRMAGIIGDMQAHMGPGVTFPPHIWLGASASTQDDLERVAPPLAYTPAPVRFLSLEPLLGPIDLNADWNLLDAGIGWVIVGAESGPHRRGCRMDWVADIVHACKEAGVPCFVKQVDRGGTLVKMPPEWPQEWPVHKGQGGTDG